MTQNEMPDEIVICPSGDKVWQEFDGATPELKYHHDRVVTAIQERNARLVEALETINLQSGFFAQDGIKEELMKNTLGQIEIISEQALAENKE